MMTCTISCHVQTKGITVRDTQTTVIAPPKPVIAKNDSINKELSDQQLKTTNRSMSDQQKAFILNNSNKNMIFPLGKTPSPRSKNPE